VSLAQIEYFLAVAEEGHVGRAARSLRIAQPAVSRQIRRLEDELGAVLFRRTPRGMELSAAGRVFLQHARIISAGVRAAAAEVSRVAGGCQTGLPTVSAEACLEPQNCSSGCLARPRGAVVDDRVTQKSARR
jgi:DNA-binding transcriptional LysR family regulator